MVLLPSLIPQVHKEKYLPMNSIPKEESLFGEIACRNRFITREKLQECIQIQKEEGKGRLLGTIMIERGCISREELRTILEIQKRNMETPVRGPQEKKADINFGVLLVKLNYLTEAQVFNGIKKQAFYARKGLFFRLGEILINEGFLNIEQVNQILSYQKKQILECPTCGKQYNASIDDPNSQICAPCQTRLRVPEKVEMVSADNAGEAKESLLSQKIIKNRFKIMQKLGQGDGSVYLAEDYLQNNLNIALKVLKVTPDQEERINSLRSTVEQAATFNCPQLLKLFDFGVYTDARTNPPTMHYFLTMEYLKGEDILKETQDVSIDDRFLYMLQILKGIEYLHKKGHLHLNLKPSNIIVLSKATQTLKILDFNLDHEDIPMHIYSAPEIVQGDKPSVASDIFSLGSLFYHILQGSPPFSLKELSHKESVSPKALRLEEYQEVLSPIFEKMFAWEPSKRYQSVWKLRADIEKLCDPALILDSSTLRKKGLDSIFACRHKLLNYLKNIFNRHFYTHQQNLLPNHSDKEDIFFIQLTSEEGNGLSHLLHHLLLFSEDVGIYFFRGYCYGAVQQPLEPFLQVFREISNLVQNSGKFHQIKDEVLKITTEILKEIGYFQSLRGEFKLAEPPDIKDLIANSLIQLSEIFPFVLSLEEVHRIDGLTIECLDTLLLKLLEKEKKPVRPQDQAKNVGLFVIAAYDHKRLSPYANTILLRWDTEKNVLRLLLEPLNEKQMTQILKALLPTFTHQEDLLRLTDQNLFYLFEFVRFFWDSPVPIFSIPENQETLTKRRLAELNPVERQCLIWMAIYQKPISQRELFFFSKQKRSEVKQAVKHLENYGLIQVLRWTPESYQIRHQKHVQHLLDHLTHPEEYHQTVLSWLLEQTKGAILSHIEELVWHSKFLNRPKRTFDYLWLACHKAKKAGDLYRALDFLAEMLDLVSKLPVPDLSRENYQNRLYQTIGSIYATLEQTENALMAYRRVNLSVLSPEKCGEMEREIAQVYLQAHQYIKAELLLNLSLKRLQNPEEKAYTYLLLTQVEINRGHYENALQHCQTAEELFQSLKITDVQHKPLCQHWRAFVYYYQGNFVDALELASESFQFAQSIQSNEIMVRSLHTMVQANIALGRYDQASRQLEKATSLAEKNNNRRSLLSSYLLMGEVHLRTGNFQQAREKYRLALKFAEELECHTKKFLSIIGLSHAFCDAQLEEDAKRYLLEELKNYPVQSSIRLQAKVMLAQIQLNEPSDLAEQEKLLQEMYEQILPLNDHELLWKLHFQIGLVYKGQNQLKLAQQSFQKAWKIIQFQWASLPPNFRQIYLKDPERQKVQQELLKISLNTSKSEPQVESVSSESDEKPKT